MISRLFTRCTILLMVAGLLLFSGCAKQAVQPEETVAPPVQDDSEAKRRAELERQKALEEERLREEARLRELAAARDRFINEHINYAFDSAVLDTRAQSVLGFKAQWLRDNPNVIVVIEGHCDERGTVQYNLALGERRAESAKMFLINAGIAPDRLVTVSYGKERPLDPASNEMAWAKNRRAQFVLR